MEFGEPSRRASSNSFFITDTRAACAAATPRQRPTIMQAMLSTIREIIFTKMTQKRLQVLLQYVRQQQVHGGSLVTAKLRNMLEALGMLEAEDWNRSNFVYL